MNYYLENKREGRWKNKIESEEIWKNKKGWKKKKKGKQENLKKQ